MKRPRSAPIKVFQSSEQIYMDRKFSRGLKAERKQVQYSSNFPSNKILLPTGNLSRNKEGKSS